MKFEWTKEARDSLRTIEIYVSDVANELTGRKLVRSLIEKAQTLSDFPQLGRAVPQTFNPCLREIFEGSYRIIYQVDSVESPSRVSILGVVPLFTAPRKYRSVGSAERLIFDLVAHLQKRPGPFPLKPNLL